MNLAEISDILKQFASEPMYLYIAAAVIVLVALLVLRLRRQPKKIVAYVTENGQVMVSRSAIVELVQTSCEQLGDVAKPRVKIRTKGKVSHLEVSIKLLSGGRLRTIEETLQRHLRHALSENLGIENLGTIDVIADGFKSGKVEQSSSVRRLPDPTVDSFDDDVVDDNDTEVIDFDKKD